MGYIENAPLGVLLSTVDADGTLYLGLNGSLVSLSNTEPGFPKIPILKKISTQRAEIIRSTQYASFENDKFVNTIYITDTPIQEGSWKIERDDLLLTFYRYEGGSWASKTTMGASIITDTFVLEDTAGQFAFERVDDGTRKILVKPSVDGYGAILGNSEGRVGFISHGENTVIYPKTKDPVWIVDNAGNGTFSVPTTYYEEDNVITADQIMEEIKIFSATAQPKFRFALLKDDYSILLQNVTPSEYDLDVDNTPLVVGENIIPLKYPIAFIKGLPIKVAMWTPGPASIELGADGKSANSILRKLAELATNDYSKKWREGFQFMEDCVVCVEAIDTEYNEAIMGKYKCLSDHTASSNFVDDLLAGYWEYINPYGYTESELKTKYENNPNTNAFTDAEKNKLSNLTGARYLGVYADISALQTAHPVGVLGDTATVTNPSGNMFYWDGSQWSDSGTGGGGDMFKSVYDPSGKNSNVYDMNNMEESSSKKIFTSSERAKLSGIEPLAEVNNISDIYANDLTDGGDTQLHFHSDDRNRSNHTGTQLASTISDFDVEVGNHPDVSANTSKLSTIESGVQANVQSDWNQTDNLADDFIKNVPNSFITVSSADTTYGYLEDKLSNDGSVVFTKQNIGGNETIRADIDLTQKPKACGYWEPAEYTYCSNSTNWYKVKPDNLNVTMSRHFTWDNANNAKRWIYNGPSGIDVYIVAMFTGSHNYVGGNNASVQWDFRVNGSTTVYPSKEAVIEKNKSMSMSLLIPCIELNTGDYIELFCKINRNGMGVYTEKMNFMIRT